jgi:endonuclease-3 related protein
MPAITSTVKTHRPFSRILMTIYHTLFDAFGPQHWWPGDTPFEVMIGALLTQNTNWHNASQAIHNLKQNNLMAPGALYKKRKSIARLIKPAGYYRIKSARIAAFLSFFLHHYNGDPEKMKGKNVSVMREELLGIVGIGPETADSIMLYALEYPVFVIDAYTRRILSRHKLCDHTAPYEEMRSLFENNLPRKTKLYNEYHALLVRTGKEYCRKNEPRCDLCPLRTVTTTS